MMTHQLAENDRLYVAHTTEWNPLITAEQSQQIMAALEAGKVIYLPKLNFSLEPAEQELLSIPFNLKRSKNISFNPKNQQLGGIDARKMVAAIFPLTSMLQRYHQYSAQLLAAFCPQYQATHCSGRTSFRPVEIKGRKPSSYRKDDTRLHVDAFPSTPVNQYRILRVFTNINPFGESHAWRLGEPFTHVVQQFLPKVRRMLPFEAELLYQLKVTRKKRTEYDHCMLQIHNRMKADLDYQRRANAVAMDFPPGSTWIVYTDLVSHAALAGRFLLKQTYYPAVEKMLHPLLSPQRQIQQRNRS